MKRAIFIFALWLGAISFAAAAGVVLEDVLSSPFPTSLIAAKGKDRVAWVFNDAGRRNIWVADGPDYKPRKLTSYDKDDGQELGSVSFSADGSLIVYVRGGETNSKNEHPNPTSDPAGVKQQVWIVPVAGGEPILLGDGAYPAISPDSKTVAYVKDGQMYFALIDRSKDANVLFHARGDNYSPTWSPDGSSLVFVSYRNDHSYIGVYHVKENRITWLAPDVDRDNHPVWSPDGKQIAFIRTPGDMANPQPGSFETSSKFAIWIADAGTGEGHSIWESSDATGGWAQDYPESPLMWAAGNRLIFYWEIGDWMRMYSVPVAGGKETQLTPAGCEAEQATLTPDKQNLIFSSNCEDIDRRHLWMVPIQGGAAKRITLGTGLEWSPSAPPESSNVVFFSSTATRPAAPAVMPLSGGNPRLLAPELLSKVPVNQLVEPQQLIFKSMDGKEIHGQLFVPKSAGTQKHPALVFMHGGPIRQMLLGWHYMDYYHNAYGMNQFLAANGYVVLSVNYRCGIGYGRSFRHAEKQGPFGASEYQDIVAAARYLQQRPDVDPSKIGLWGGSYGGYLTAMGLARDSQLFAAGVDFHGVHDWSLRAKLRGGKDWGVIGDEAMRLAYDSSPVADVSTWTSPVLFIIGDDDRNVDFIETTDLVQRLRKEGKAHLETLIFPDEVHDLLCHRTWLRAYDATLRFFDHYLK